MNPTLMFSLLIATTLFASSPVIMQEKREPSLRSKDSLEFKAQNKSQDPNLGSLTLIAQLPTNLPQRISSMAYDGEKIWVAIYMGHGQYATLDPLTLEWKVSEETRHHRAIAKVVGRFESPGGISFVKDSLWVSDSYGESLGFINLKDWTVTRIFKQKYQPNTQGSQSYSDMTYDGTHLWIAWHSFYYRLPTSETQLLLKIDPETGQVIAKYSLPPGTVNDGAHALTWDGTKLWHMKDSRLSSIDPSSGTVTAQHTVTSIRRPNGMVWVNNALWIGEFDGKIWRLEL